MPKFMIERHIPGAGKMSREQLREVAAKSNAIVAGLGVPYTWHESFVAGDTIYCVHEADSAEIIYRHAREGGCPADKVTKVDAEFGPATAKAAG